MAGRGACSATVTVNGEVVACDFPADHPGGHEAEYYSDRLEWQTLLADFAPGKDGE